MVLSTLKWHHHPLKKQASEVQSKADDAVGSLLTAVRTKQVMKIKINRGDRENWSIKYCYKCYSVIDVLSYYLNRPAH